MKVQTLYHNSVCLTNFQLFQFAVFWAVTPRGVMVGYHRFRGL